MGFIANCEVYVASDALGVLGAHLSCLAGAGELLSCDSSI
jgi:hypothetical protein